MFCYLDSGSHAKLGPVLFKASASSTCFLKRFTVFSISIGGNHFFAASEIVIKRNSIPLVALLIMLEPLLVAPSISSNLRLVFGVFFLFGTVEVRLVLGPVSWDVEATCWRAGAAVVASVGSPPVFGTLWGLKSPYVGGTTVTIDVLAYN